MCRAVDWWPRMVCIGLPGPGRRHALSFERIFSLGKPIDDLFVNQIIAVMLFADSEDEKNLWYLYIYF